MMPVTPHTAEEMWEQSGFDGMVSEAQFPEYDPAKYSADAEYGEDLIRNILSDSAQIIKVTGMQPLDCFAAASDIAFHLATFFSAFVSSSLTTARLVATGTILAAPSSTAFVMMSSILSALGSA